MNFKLIKLGTVCKDTATGLSGMLTHCIITMDHQIVYLFQPKGLNDEGQPVPKLFLGEKRLQFKETDIEDVYVPFEILGSTVTDKASGFTGMAIEFIRHINGCFHIRVQPAGLVKKTQSPAMAYEFDIRQCSGEKITVLSQPELTKSRLEKPSPTGDRFDRQAQVTISVSGARHPIA